MTQPSPRQRFGYLPAPLMAVLEVTRDEDLVWRIVARAGGRQMKVPVTLTPANQLVEALGPIDAEAAWTVWRRKGARATARGHLVVSIPMMTSAMALARGRRLLALVEGGCTVHEAARRCGMTERGAYKAMARARAAGPTVAEPPRQMDMFPA